MRPFIKHNAIHFLLHALLWCMLLPACNKNKTEALNDTEKLLKGKWYLTRSEKTMYVPTLGSGILADYYNWYEPAEGYIEFRENREMYAGTAVKKAGMDYLEHWQLQGNQLQATFAGGNTRNYTFMYNGSDSLHITEPHDPDYRLHYYFGREPRKFFFPAVFTPFLGKWHVYEVKEYNHTGQLQASYSFGSNSSFMQFSNTWILQQGYTFGSGCYQCPFPGTWKPLKIQDNYFIYSGEYYEAHFSDSTHIELIFPGIHFPVQGNDPGLIYHFLMEKE